MRKLIAFDEETYQAIAQLSRDRMGTLQELADEAFRDLLKKHGVPVNLKDALQRSAKKKPLAAKGRYSRKHTVVTTKKASQA
ncbi:MAG: hypothetical protein K2W78_06330 [Xanthobacteraceae bacterium]|nr:hypothetical protein [Xanthobacteraceae bacterium]